MSRMVQETQLEALPVRDRAQRMQAQFERTLAQMVERIVKRFAPGTARRVAEV